MNLKLQSFSHPFINFEEPMHNIIQAKHFLLSFLCFSSRRTKLNLKFIKIMVKVWKCYISVQMMGEFTKFFISACDVSILNLSINLSKSFPPIPL